MRRVILLIILAAIFGLALLPTYNWLKSRPGREWRILALANITRTGGSVALGDSIVEQSFIRSKCGALNAGVGGTSVSDTLAFAPTILSSAHPSKVILGVGVNDAQSGATTPLPKFERSYSALMDLLGDRLVAVIKINPIEPGMRYSHRINMAAVNAENAVIDALARRRGGVKIIEPPLTVRGRTVDGIHPNELGKIGWIERLGEVCASSPMPS